MIGKKCSKCKEHKAYSRFSRLASSPTGRAYWCKDCVNGAHKLRPKLPYSPPQHLKKKYGLTIEQYNQMVQEQESKCKICLIVKDKLEVDHVHDTTKRVRGLLCHNCNTMLGHAKDSIDTLISAITMTR